MSIGNKHSNSSECIQDLCAIGCKKSFKILNLYSLSQGNSHTVCAAEPGGQFPLCCLARSKVKACLCGPYSSLRALLTADVKFAIDSR